MKKVTFQLIQTKVVQDKSINIPDDVFEQGDPAVEDWLYNNGYIDDALDYAETDTELSLIYEN